MDTNTNTLNNPGEKWISMPEAAILTAYSAEYLSLRARQGKLTSKKINNEWYTTKEALDAYLRKQMLRTKTFENHKNGHANVVLPPLVPAVASPTSPAHSLDVPAGLKQVRSYPSDERDFALRDNKFSPPVESVSSVPNKITEPAHIEKVSTESVKQSKAKKILTSRNTFLTGALATLLLFSTFQTPLVKGVFDKPISLVKDKVSEAKGAIAFYMNLNKNEILLINKEGTVAITGSIGTNTPYGNGVVPIVLETITGSSTPSSGSAYTLAFVTSNGNITTEDVFLEGEVEIGKTLMVKGATKLLSALEIDGDLKVFGNAEFNQALSVLGPAYFHALLTAEDILAKGNLEVNKNIEATGSITAGRSIVGKSGSFTSLSSKGNLSAQGEITLGNDDDTISIDSSNFTLDSTGNAHIFGALNLDGNLTGTTATLTSATSTNFFSTNLTATNQAITDLIFTNATGTSATTTNLFSTTASSTNLFATSANLGTLTSGLINGQTISSSANFTGTAAFAGNVGIGTTSPVTLLDVNGASAFRQTLNIVGTPTPTALASGANLELGSDSDRTDMGGTFRAFVQAFDRTNTVYGDLALAGREISFNPNGTEKVRIDTDGNVGIGTTDPSTTLHVVNGTAGTVPALHGGEAFIVQRNGTTGTRADMLLLAGNAAESRLQFGDADNVAVGMVTYHHSNNSMRFTTNDSERMRIDSAGNVGIGTTDPNYKLEVNGTLGFTDIGAGGTTYDATIFHSAGSPYRSLNLLSQGGAGGWRGAINLNVNYNAGSPFTGLTVKANTDGTTANVGIGVTNPSVLLEVGGITKISSGGNSTVPSLRIYSDTIGLASPLGTDLSLIVGSVTRLNIDASGNLIISDLVGVGNRCLYADSTGQINVKGFDCGSASGGDNLGDHVATQNLNIGSNWIGAGNSIGLQVVESGNRITATIKSTGEHAFLNIDSAHSSTYLPNISFLRAGVQYGQIGLQRASSSGGDGSNYTESQMIVGTNSTVPLALITNSIRRVTVDSSGNVGIGTPTPGAALDVADGALTMILGADANARTRTNATAKVSRVGSYHYTNAEEPFAIAIGSSDATSNILAFGGSSSLTNAATAIQFWTAANNTTVTGSQRMLIDSSGRVGIGPGSTVSYPLQVVKDGAAISGGFVNVANFAPENGSKGVNIGYDSNSVTGIIASNNASSNLAFWTHSGSWGERMRISASGNVGIGTTTPATTLDVNGTIRAMGSNTPTTGAGVEILRSGGVGYVYNYDRDTSTNGDLDLGLNALMIKGSGNVGIGTTTPEDLLHVHRSVNNSTGGLLIKNTFGSGYGGAINITSADMTYGRILAESSSANTSEMKFLTTVGGSLAERMRINSAGNVGIGTTDPTEKLVVAGNVTAQAGAFSVTNGGSAVSNSMFSPAANELAFSSNGTERIRIDSSGNVGIGISPASVNKLQVKQATDINFGIRGAVDVTGAVVLQATNDAVDTNIPLEIRASKTIFSIGNVGIGTVSPATSLEVAKTIGKEFSTNGNFQIAVMDTTSSAQGVGGAISFRGYKTTTSAAGLFAAIDAYKENATAANEAGSLRFHTSSAEGSVTEKMRITSAGNVGIGTTNPSEAKLVIAGGSIQLDNNQGINTRLTNGTSLQLIKYNSSNNTLIGANSEIVLNGGITFPNLTSGANGTYLCFASNTITQGSSCSASSERFKQNIENLNYGLDEVLQMRAVSFTYRPEMNLGSNTDIGFIAEEMLLLVPEVVNIGKDGQLEGIDYQNLTSVLARAVQELNLKVETNASSTQASLSSLALDMNVRLSTLENLIASSTALSLDATTTTVVADSFLAGASSALRDRVRGIVSEVVQFYDGAVYFTTGIFNKVLAREVKTDLLCITDEGGETCISRSQLDAMLANSNTQAPITNEESSTNTQEPIINEEPIGETATSTEETIVVEEPAATTTEETIIEEPTPEPTPDIEPTPEPEPEPTPEPAPEPPLEPTVVQDDTASNGAGETEPAPAE